MLRRQGGGTFQPQSRLWQSFSDPLVELLSDHPGIPPDLLETRHALEGIAAYYAALRSNDEDRDRIRELHQAIERAQQSGDWTLSPAPSSSIKSPSLRRYNRGFAPSAKVYGADAGAKRASETLNYCMPQMPRWSATIRPRIFEASNGRGAGAGRKRRTITWRSLKFLLDSREQSRRERFTASFTATKGMRTPA